MGIPEILMNIMSCHGFSTNLISTWHSALVTFNISKGIFIVDTEEGNLDNITIRVKK